MISGRVESPSQLKSRCLFGDGRLVRARPVHIESDGLAGPLPIPRQLIHELGVTLAPQGLADEVGPALEASSGSLLADVEELVAHAMHVADDGPRVLPHGARKLDGAVAVGVHHPLVERVDDQRPRDAVEEVDVRVRDGVLPVVGVHHAHDVVEGVAPRRPLVAPVDVLRLLEHRHVALLLRHAPRRVARRQDAGKLGGVDAVVEGDSDPRVAPQLLPHPLANEGLLVLLACKGHITGEEKLLIFSRYPRHAQCDSVLLRPLLQIHSSKEWVH
mmetsp:Transcript_56904/g.149907  ORF Transcript_56904/g.149907 Transcript_56904/m.149907 type:complete len:273 (-) Transcript_56904:178-996(-)